MEERGGRKEEQGLLPSRTVTVEHESDTERKRPTATLISFDRLAEFERGEPAREPRRLTRPEWMREPAWLDRACRDPRIIRASQWVTGGSVIVAVLAVAWFVNATMLDAAPVKGTPTISASAAPSKTAPARVRPSAIVPVEPKLPQPPPRTTLSPRKTKARATPPPAPTRTREPSVEPPTPKPTKTIEKPKPEPSTTPSGGPGNNSPSPSPTSS